jgi:hypothetical protein
LLARLVLDCLYVLAHLFIVAAMKVVFPTLWYLLSGCLTPRIARSMAIKGDTAVVGVGVLGRHLCRMILDDSTSTSVMGVTKTSTNHNAILQDIGHAHRFQLITSEESCSKRFDNVVFCAPPSGFADYPQAVQSAIDRLWAGSEKGVFVFTSSGAV